MVLQINTNDVDFIVPVVVTHTFADVDTTTTKFTADLNVEYLQQYNDRTIYLEVKRFVYERTPSHANHTGGEVFKCESNLKLMNSTTNSLFVSYISRVAVETLYAEMENVQLLELAKIPGGNIEFKFLKANNEGIVTYMNEANGVGTDPRSIFSECAFYFNLYIMKE